MKQFIKDILFISLIAIACVVLLVDLISKDRQRDDVVISVCNTSGSFTQVAPQRFEFTCENKSE